MATLTRDFYDHTSLSKHFINSHLKPLADNVKMACPICPEVTLFDKNHLRNHAEGIHGIKTDEKRKRARI